MLLVVKAVSPGKLLVMAAVGSEDSQLLTTFSKEAEARASAEARWVNDGFTRASRDSFAPGRREGPPWLIAAAEGSWARRNHAIGAGVLSRSEVCIQWDLKFLLDGYLMLKYVKSLVKLVLKLMKLISYEFD